MTMAFLRAIVAVDPEAASGELGADVSDAMTEDLVDFAGYRLAQLEADPSVQEWLGRAMVLTEPGGRRRAIGTIGFHGPPDDRQRAEIGYRVEPEYRRRGYAREAIRAMFDWAHGEHGIRTFVASISPTNDASRTLARGFGFVQVGEQMDEIDGLEHVFEAPWPPANAEMARVDDAAGHASAGR
jgi:ribosomal-protein-alanine N-acetyltransferase